MPGNRDGPGANYKKAGQGIPSYPGSSVIQKDSRYVPRSPDYQQKSIDSNYRSKAHSDNRSKGHASSTKLYQSQAGYGPIKAGLSRSQVGGKSQEQEFANHRAVFAEQQEARRGTSARARSPSRETQMNYPSQRSITTKMKAGPMGEDPNHREYNQFKHNGAYRDPRWDGGVGSSWGGHGVRRQNIIDETWRVEAKQRSQEHKKQLAKESNALDGPRWVAAPRNDAALAQEYAQYQKFHDLQSTGRTPFNTDVQSDWERRRYEKSYSEAYAAAYPEVAAPPQEYDQLQDPYQQDTFSGLSADLQSGGVSQALAADAKQRMAAELTQEMEQLEQQQAMLSTAMAQRRAMLSDLQGDQPAEDQQEFALDEMAEDAAPSSPAEDAAPVVVELQMQALFKQVNQSNKGMDLHDGRRLASVLIQTPSSGQVFSLYESIGAEPCDVNENSFGMFIMGLSNTCFGLLCDPETAMIDRSAAHQRLGTSFESPACTPASSPALSGRSGPSSSVSPSNPPPLPSDSQSPKSLGGFAQSLSYNQFVTYVVSEMRRAVSKGVYHVTLASLYELAMSQ